ncbi:MAG: hypothetical protein R3C16_09370 [Hyphomonadaceae bacterium]
MVHGGDDRGGQAHQHHQRGVQVLNDAAHISRRIGTFCGKAPLKVAADAEDIARAAQRHGAHAAALADLFDRDAQIARQFVIDRVGAFRAA